MVFVSGNLIVRRPASRCLWVSDASPQTEGESRPNKFSQVFHLMPAGTSWFVYNDMFRLVRLVSRLVFFGHPLTLSRAELRVRSKVGNSSV